MIIYKATNLINNKSYIGCTKKTLEERKDGHFYQQNRLNSKFYKALREYGFDVFDWAILEETDSVNKMLNLEMYYIKKYNTFYDGYNSTHGGDDVSQTKTKNAIFKWKKSHKKYRHSNETRKKISNATIGRKPWCTGLTKYTDDRLKKMGEKISKASKGRYVSEETKRKQSIAHIGYKFSDDIIKKRNKTRKANGKPWHSKETISKMKVSATGKESPNRGKKMSDIQKNKISKSLTIDISLDIKNEILLKYKNGMKIYSISKYMNLSRYIIKKCLKNREN